MKDTDSGNRVSRRYRYTENYTVHSDTAPDGSKSKRIEYTGAYYIPEHPEKTYESVKKTARITAVAAWAAILVLLGTKGFSVYNGGLYVLVPATAATIPGIYLILGSMKLPSEDRKMQKDIYRFSIGRLRRSAAGVLALLGMTAAAAIFFFLHTGAAAAPPDYLFAGLILAAGTLLTVFLRKAGQLSYSEEIDNDDHNQETDEK